MRHPPYSCRVIKELFYHRGCKENWLYIAHTVQHSIHNIYNSFDPSELAAKGVLRARRLCCLRRETAFSPESAAGSSEAGSYRSPFCASSRSGADRRWGFGASLL